MTEHSDSATDKANQFYHEAMKLNPEDNYSRQAEELLEKALKFNPDHADALVALGYTVLQKGKADEAENYFRTAVTLCKEGKPGNKTDALCALSVGIRYAAESKGDAAPLFYAESITVAKEAVQTNLESGKCWYTLGMAYLSRFFHEGRAHPTDLSDCLSAFQFAEKKPNAPLADLHANRGTVFQFLASFHNARGDFEEALRLDPTFTSINKQLESLKKTFDLVHHIIMKKNVPKSKLDQLPTDTTLLKDLDKEKNPDKRISGVVMQCASLSTETPQLFVCADRSDSRFVVALYDVAANAVPDGATIQISAPRLAPFSWDGKLVHPLISVENVGTLLVNGQPIPSSLRTLAQIN